MIRQQFVIGNDSWQVEVFYLPWKEDIPTVAEAYERIGCPDSDIDKICHIIASMNNKGATYSSGYHRKSVVMIGRASSWDQLFDTVLHEVKHVVDDIVLWYRINNHGEPPAYLQGEIGRLMAPAIRMIACPCCGGTAG